MRKWLQAKQNEGKNATWGPSASVCLLKFLVEQALNDNKPAKGFKSATISAAACHVNAKLQTNYSETNVQNHLRTIRRNWKIIQRLKLMSGNTYDHDINMIVMDEDVHKTYIESKPKEEKFINKPIKLYNEMEIICGNELAIGVSAKDLNHDPSSLIIHSIGDDVDGGDVQATTSGAEPTIPRERSITPSPRDGGSRKRKSSEEDGLEQYFVQMKEALQGLNTRFKYH